MKANTIGWVAALAIGAAAGVAGSRWTAGGEAGQGSGAAAPAPAAAPAARRNGKAVVEVEPVSHMPMPRGVSAVGTLRSADSVMLRPEITGRIAEINFQEGGKVSKGQVVVRLDDGVARAQLRQAQANLSLAVSQNRRAAELNRQGFISRQARDEAANQMQVQQAAVALAKANLEKTAILAPFDGFIGLRNVSVGDYVGPGNDLVPITSIDPLQVDFRVPEQYLSLVRPGQKLTLRFDALPGLAREGEVGAISPSVDVGGRSILLRANVGNADGVLRPGMFSRVQLRFADANVLVIPETAFVPSGQAQYAYRVVDGKAQRAAIQTGQRRDGKVEVVGGLDEGDLVVVAGLQKISDGADVDVAARAAEPAGSRAGGP